MGRTRSVSHILDGTTLTFLYRRSNPSTGSYFTNSDITAVTLEIRNIESTAVALLSPSAMTYDSALDGFKFVWTYGAALNGVRSISARFVPTRAATTAAALAPTESIEVDLANILARLGAPAGASLAADVAAVRDEQDADETAILGRLGTPTGASVSADVAAIRAEQDADEAAILAAVTSSTGTILAAVSAALTAILTEMSVDEATILAAIAAAEAAILAGITASDQGAHVSPS